MDKGKIAAGVVSAAVALVAAWEGRSLIAYADPVGIPTICEGFTHGVKLGDVATPERCDALTEQEVRRALAVVDGSVPRPLPDSVRVALASFVYNVGPGAYGGSTLTRKLRAGDLAGACRELPRWVYAGGTKLRGLERRRDAEMRICLSELQ
ncbi:lysozyme [Bordetella avium]|uniref:lysozyme n=4 Tax=Bordetella avium TaxID=521 RepID=UPI000E0B3799|nr:lysozyme [Bordetella avium]RIQ11559.1 lysozyme [Bordetella avium]RIQ44942.1 lysozyme [Bordetella avium]RIQ49592.1 lysozyme [Bordetella avium]RIQ55311.1 lysozyme [Bordetella avium]RIQ58437.1 lysozyme [Bordetella avium]